jgi:hypothetical protein
MINLDIIHMIFYNIFIMDYKNKYIENKKKFLNLRRQFDEFKEDQKFKKCRADKYKSLLVIILIRLKYIIMITLDIIQMIFCNIFIMDYKDKYIKYKFKYYLLRSNVYKQIEELPSLTGGTKEYKIGDIKQFDGSGGTKSVEIKVGDQIVGYVVCTPFYFYGSFRPINSNYNYLYKSKELIEILAYKKYINENI